MFFGLLLMAALGVGGLVLANHYSKAPTGNTASTITPQ